MSSFKILFSVHCFCAKTRRQKKQFKTNLDLVQKGYIVLAVLVREAGAPTVDAKDLVVIEVIASTVGAKGYVAHLGVTQRLLI